MALRPRTARRSSWTRAAAAEAADKLESGVCRRRAGTGGRHPPPPRKGAPRGAECGEQRGRAVRGARRRACAERAGAPMAGGRAVRADARSRVHIEAPGGLGM